MKGCVVEDVEGLVARDCNRLLMALHAIELFKAKALIREEKIAATRLRTIEAEIRLKETEERERRATELALEAAKKDMEIEVEKVRHASNMELEEVKGQLAEKLEVDKRETLKAQLALDKQQTAILVEKRAILSLPSGQAILSANGGGGGGPGFIPGAFGGGMAPYMMYGGGGYGHPGFGQQQQVPLSGDQV